MFRALERPGAISSSSFGSHQDVLAASVVALHDVVKLDFIPGALVPNGKLPVTTLRFGGVLRPQGPRLRLQDAHRFAQRAGHVGQLLGSKQQKADGQNDEQVPGLDGIPEH